ncbi:hypothetical protein PsorP6_015809 [Peronosclerospora sorghi]|uniref:Uncharacterized protein n=1 Tax=Peronosclerospora sorghi TaxID=230839 RepID=A0ACC0WQ22_9STRA|nr:hypothetical protein PsorP6_015809 [Peronosclerospora sorghi]
MGQRVVNSADINRDKLDIKKVFVKHDMLNIVWSDEHESSFSTKWLLQNTYSEVALDCRIHDMTTTPLALDAPVPSAEYDCMMDTSDDEGLHEVLRQIIEHGFVVICYSPSVPDEVKQLAERIDPISQSYVVN